MTPTATEKPVRLDRLLANLGYGSRTEVVAAIRRGYVIVDGSVVRSESTKVVPDPTRVLFNREPIDDPSTIVIALHKPVGSTCSHDDREAPLVYDLLPPRWQLRNPRVEAVGRLDRDTSGLLLLTDDHQLLHRLSSPKHHVAKRYVAMLDVAPPNDLAARFGSGELLLEREATPCLPALVEVISERTIVVTLTEGRYHQVRRMFASVGCHVEALVRESVGALTIAELGLAPGEYCRVEPAQLTTAG